MVNHGIKYNVISDTINNLIALTVDPGNLKFNAYSKAVFIRFRWRPPRPKYLQNVSVVNMEL